MTLEKTLRQHLGDARPGGCRLTSGGWNISLVTDKSDSLSCSLQEITLERDLPIQQELKPWAERLAQRVTGLLEPLRLVEADRLLDKAILRSQSPALAGSATAYYELVLERAPHAKASLHRYTADRQNGEKRQAVPFVLTHDAIVKLVSDLVSEK